MRTVFVAIFERPDGTGSLLWFYYKSDANTVHESHQRTNPVNTMCWNVDAEVPEELDANQIQIYLEDRLEQLQRLNPAAIVKKYTDIAEPDSQPNGRTWEEFLTKECEIRDQAFDVIHYGVSNENFIVFPTGEFLHNFAFHGKTIMDQVRQQGWQMTLNNLKAKVQKNQEITQNLCNALDGLTNSLQEARKKADKKRT